MKKNVSKVLALFLVFAVFMTSGVSAFAETSDVVGQKESVIAQAKPFDMDRPTQQVVNSYAVDGIPTAVLDSEIRAELRDWGLDTTGVTQVEEYRDNLYNPDETLKKYIVDNEHHITLDSENNIYSIFNSDEDILAPGWDADWETTEADYLATGARVLDMMGLDDSYELVYSAESTVDFWSLIYKKVESNGIVNDYDGVNLTIARKDASVAFLYAFDMKANTQNAEVSETEALAAAKPIMDKRLYADRCG